MRLRALWAFDFDGVICDSASEVAKSAWRASLVEWPQLRQQWPDEPPKEILGGFRKIRPALETGWEAMLMLHVLMDQAGKGLGAPDPDRFAADFHEKTKPSLLRRLGSSEAGLATQFDAARNTWIASDRAGWLAANGFYPVARDALAALLASRSRGGGGAAVAAAAAAEDGHAGASGGGAVAGAGSSSSSAESEQKCAWQNEVFVLTTKSPDFTVELLKAAGLSLPSDRIFGRGSGPKTETLQLLAAQDEYASVVFVEDRLPALEAVAAAIAADGGSGSFATLARPLPKAAAAAAALAAGEAAATALASSSPPALSLCLAGWGYNTPGDRVKARDAGDVVVLESQEAFAAFVEPFVARKHV